MSAHRCQLMPHMRIGNMRMRAAHKHSNVLWGAT